MRASSLVGLLVVASTLVSRGALADGGDAADSRGGATAYSKTVNLFASTGPFFGLGLLHGNGSTGTFALTTLVGFEVATNASEALGLQLQVANQFGTSEIPFASGTLVGALVRWRSGEAQTLNDSGGFGAMSAGLEAGIICGGDVCVPGVSPVVAGELGWNFPFSRQAAFTLSTQLSASFFSLLGIAVRGGLAL